MASLTSCILTLVGISTLVSLGHGFFIYSNTKKQHNFDRSGPANNQWSQYSTRAEALWPPQMSSPNGQPQPQPPTYAFDATNSAFTVALPVALPVHAQVAAAQINPPAHSPPAAASLHNVQLVPCLCPVAKDFDPSPPPAPTASPSSPSYVIQTSSPP